MTAYPISRRNVLRGAAALGAGLATGVPVRATAVQPTHRPPRNVQVSHDGLAAHAETCLAVNPTDTRHLLGACIAQNSSDENVIAAYASFDRGVSWHNFGALPGANNGRDPSVTFDAYGRGYICANTDDVHVWRTANGGHAFADPVLATHGQKLDHPWLCAAPGRSEAGVLYGAWTTGLGNTQLGFTRSTDAGTSFEPQTVIATVNGPTEANFASPMVAAGRAGSVYVAYGVWPPSPPGQPRSEIIAAIRISCSRGYGQTWQDPVDIGAGAIEVRVTPDTTSPGLPAVAASKRHDLAAVAFITREPNAMFTDIAVAVSTNRGRDWSTAQQVSRGGSNAIYFQPQLAIDEAGALAVTAFAYHDGVADVRLFTASPGTTRFGEPITVTDRPFDPTLGEQGGKHGAWWIGDYQGLASGSGSLHPFWNDTRTGDLQLFTASIHP